MGHNRDTKSKRHAHAPPLRTVGSLKERHGEPEEWVIEINTRLREGHTYDAGRSWTIYRVPNRLQEVQRSAFTPKVVSIGPFHYGEPRFRATEEHKMRYLMRLLGGKFEEDKNGKHRDDIVHEALHLEDLANAMRQLEQKTRACYSEFFDIPSEEFVQMMVIDGCFVVELLRLFHKFEKAGKAHFDDPIFTTRWMLRTLQRDLLILENQLPLFVLQELFTLTEVGHEKKYPSLEELAVSFFNPLLPRGAEYLSGLDFKKEEHDHLLYLFRSTFLSKVKKRENNDESVSDPHGNNASATNNKQLVHCAKELEDAGIEFFRREGCDVLDVGFIDGVLEIPQLYIDDNTVPLFFNFIALEQCDEEPKPFFTNFFVFLDSLIYTSADVQILRKEGIINHIYGSDKDVAILINRLCREIVYDQDQCYLSEQMKAVNDHCKKYYESKWRLWGRNLIRDYFSNPWTVLSLLAALTLLLLTFAQTLYTMFAYYQQF